MVNKFNQFFRLLLFIHMQNISRFSKTLAYLVSTKKCFIFQILLYIKEISIYNFIHKFQAEFYTFTFKEVNSRKLGLRQKGIILPSKIAILLLKGSFKREKINSHEKNLKDRKILFLPDLFFLLLRAKFKKMRF